MSYCVALKLSYGLVFMSDTLTNGGLDNIRLKFIGHLAQFSNLEIDTEYETEFISKMNTNDAFGDTNEDAYDGSPF